MVAREGVTPEMVERLEYLRDHPREGMLGLHIEDKENALRPIGTYLPEQEEWVDAITTCQKVLAVKPRQLGFTTITLAYLFWKALFAKHGRKILSMAHEDSAVDRLHVMTNVFHDELPPEIKPGLIKNNREVTQFRRVDRDGKSVPGPMLVRALAGARGQARGWTYNDYHATEMAHWPTGTSARKNEEGRSADEEAFASATATLHDPTQSVIVESTGNGPRGLFYELYQQATTDPAWRFVFQKWTDVVGYRVPLTDREKRALENDLDDYEKHTLIGKFGLDLEQIAWRRTRMRTYRMTFLTFRREFPLTDMEPFLFDEHGWYSQEALHDLMQFVPRPLGASAEPFRVFREYDPLLRYSIGCDTAGGVGRDESVITVADERNRQCAIWASNKAPPEETALWLSRISNQYGRPPAIVEANNHGMDVIERGIDLGVPMWTNEHGEFFWSTGRRNGDSKRKVCVHSREVIDNGWCILNDALTIRQAQTVVEKPNGKIEASGTKKHDDRIYAWGLALWGTRKFWSGSPAATMNAERERIRRIQALGRADGRGGWT